MVRHEYPYRHSQLCNSESSLFYGFFFTDKPRMFDQMEPVQFRRFGKVDPRIVRIAAATSASFAVDADGGGSSLSFGVFVFSIFEVRLA
jgi:hypothetical protein